VTEPFTFDEEYTRALVAPLHDKLSIRFVSLATLIRMKEEAVVNGGSANVSEFTLGSTGALAQLAGSPAPVGTNPGSIAIVWQ
jgi:hypothetical protein